MLNIRDAKKSDFIAISELYEQVDKLHRTEHPNIFREPSILGRPSDYLQALIDSENTKFIVAELEDQVVGFSESYVMQESDYSIIQPREWLLIDSIAVDKRIHRNGVGQSMLNYLIDWSKEKGLSEIELKVYSFNEQAINFYDKNGFKELSRTLNYKIK